MATFLAHPVAVEKWKRTAHIRYPVLAGLS